MRVLVLCCGLIVTWLSVVVSTWVGEQLERPLVTGREEQSVGEVELNAGNETLYTTREEVNCSKSNKWLVENDKTGKCHCGIDYDGVIQCSTYTNEVLVLDCFCMTQASEGDDGYVVGGCIFNCGNLTRSGHDSLYHGTPSDCSSLNRKGIVCGECRDGHALPAYSYTFKCMKCDNEHQHWWLYIIFAFLPLTVFILITLVFRINVMDPKLHVFVLAAQNLAAPIQLRILLPRLQHGRTYKAKIVIFLATVYGIWNLDFFRVNILPDICINIIPLHTMALDYLVAFYPMLLMGVAYIMVELHAAGCRPILYIWRPFHRICVRFRRHWGIQTSIMDAFVTFFVLSTTKLFSVTYDFLVGTAVVTPDGRQTLRMFNNPDIKLLHREHLPYALLAITIVAVFIMFPLFLLLCYQSKVFRRCITVCQLRGATLDEFVETFQQYYKDGSDGTADCRWFSGFFIIIKIAAFAVYAVTLAEIGNVLLSVLCMSAAIILIIVNPYKKEYEMFNTVYAVFLLWEALFFQSMTAEGLSSILSVRFDTTFLFSILLGLIPFLYITVVTLRHLCKRFQLKKHVGEMTTPTLLPDRLMNSNEYRDSFGYIAASPQDNSESNETET